MLFVLIILILALAGSAAGVALIVRSERISDHHQCLDCGYDLRGIPNAPKCPECGTNLDGTNTIVPGQWRTRKSQMAAGAVLLIFGVIGAIFAALGLIAVGMTD